MPENLDDILKQKYAEEVIKRKRAVLKHVLYCVDEVLKNGETISSQFRLKKIVLEAVNLGMHRETNVIVDYAGVSGLSFDVQKYINTLYEKVM